MGSKYRIGLWSAGAILLAVLVAAGMVWRDADGTTIERILRPEVEPNEVVVIVELALQSGIRVHPGANVSVKCTATSNDREELSFTCNARRRR